MTTRVYQEKEYFSFCTISNSCFYDYLLLFVLVLIIKYSKNAYMKYDDMRIVPDVTSYVSKVVCA